jgi:hypothetical protein
MDRMPPPLCGHESRSFVRRGHRLVCPSCSSYWDAEQPSRPVRYDGSYASARSHFDPIVGAQKIRSLDRWLTETGIDCSGRTVCEVGFGGAHCLRSLHGRSERAFGIEVSPEHLEQAVGLGLPSDRLWLFDGLPRRLPEAVDLWIFQDSFEHLPDPGSFLSWMTESSSPGAQVLLVAPEAGCLSDRLLGRWWPHRLPDHSFHWSKKGIEQVFRGQGFLLTGDFFPWKHVSAWSVVSHLAHKLGVRPPSFSTKLASVPLLFNVGEMGLVFRKGAA